MVKQEKMRMPIWLVIAGLMLSFSVLGVTVVRARQTEEMGVEDKTAEEMVMEEEKQIMMEKESEAVDYYLPYPGILPDHPFYWLKMIRDRVQLWLTTKPVAKAEKLLLYADKRLGAGWALIEGNKQELGVTTLTKAEKYLERARLVAGELGEGEQEKALKERLTKAVVKHSEVLELLTEKIDESNKAVIEQMIELIQREDLKGSMEMETESLGPEGEIEDETMTEMEDKEDKSDEGVVEGTEKERETVDQEVEELSEE